MEHDTETYSTDGPTCPYCGHVSNPSEEPSCYSEDNDEWTCESCGEDYQLEVYVRHSWTGRRRDE